MPADLPPDDVEHLLRTLTRFNRWVTRAAEFSQDVVTGRLLSLIDELQPVRLSQLAAADHTTQPTMTTHVRRLRQQGLITREPDPTDARAGLLTLSPAGRAALTQLRAARGDVLRPRLAALSPEEVATLTAATAILDRLLGDEAADS